MPRLVPALLVALSLTMLPGLALAASWYVSEAGDDSTGDGSFDNPFATIQHALALAAPGDAVRLLAGTYTGPGNRDLDFAGESVWLGSDQLDAALVTIDCGGSLSEPHRLTFFQAGEDSSVVVEAVTITGGYADWGGAVRVGTDAYDEEPITPHFVSCVFTGNQAAEGGGAVSVEQDLGYDGGNHRPVFTDCRFRENSAPHGGAVYTAWYEHADLRQSVFYRNAAENGGAIFHAFESRSGVAGCVFRENTATDDGGAVYSQFEQVTGWWNCRFVSNEAEHLGGAFHNPLGFSASQNRPGVRLPIAEQFHACRFDSNRADGGGAVHLWHCDFAKLFDCEFYHNTAVSFGGAVATGYAGLRIERGIFVGNSAPAAAAIMMVSGGGCGGDPFRILQCTIVGNLGGAAVSLHEVNYCVLEIRNTIIAFNDGPAYEATFVPDELAVITVDANDFYGNAGGDWPPPLDDQLGVDLNISLDPLFCDPADGNHALEATSPCAPGNHPEGGDLLIGAFGVGCSLAPTLLSLSDVPDDDGGQLRLVWSGSWHDRSDSPSPVTGYGVYRQGAPGNTPVTQTRLLGWDYLETVPARGDSAYQWVAPTLCDSTPADSCASVFLVSATTVDPLTYWDSAPDSGYSVNNLPPPPPLGLVVTYDYVDGHALVWQASGAADLDCYLVYRGDQPGFPPDQEHLVGQTQLVEWVDAATAPNLHYKVSAMDCAGNESQAASPELLVGTESPPVATRMVGAHPNPFNPATRLVYELAGPSRVTLRIYDLRGRLVAEPIAARQQAAGRHAVVWQARDGQGRALPSGRYVAELTAGAVVETSGLTLLR